jgi:hypothetical protein
MAQLLGEILGEMGENDEGVASPMGVALVPINLKVVAPLTQKILALVGNTPEVGHNPHDDVCNALIMASAVIVATQNYDGDMGEAFAEMLSRTASVVTSTAYAAKQIEEPEPTEGEIEADTELSPVV